jgi:hypothetical protein
MLETYGKFTALDGTEFHYSDFRASRKEAADKAEAHDKRILAARENQKGRPLTTRESLAPATPEETPPSKPSADIRKPASSDAVIAPPFPFTAPAKELTPGEESAKKMFAEMHLAAARAQLAKNAQRAMDAPPSP